MARLASRVFVQETEGQARDGKCIRSSDGKTHVHQITTKFRVDIPAPCKTGSRSRPISRLFVDFDT